MPDIDTVDISITVEACVATALDDAAVRAMAGHLVSRTLQPVSIGNLFDTMDAISAEAPKCGLTDEILDVELAAYHAQRREPIAPSIP